MKENKNDDYEKETSKSELNLSEDIDDFIFRDEAYRHSEK